MCNVLGIHHMSAISGPAQENLDFYVGVLGLRLVKLTVNFDDPTAYHLYYGDGVGTPGTLLTFFPYPGGHPGRPGAGQTTVIHLSIPHGSMQFWTQRFQGFDVDYDRPQSREGVDSMRFRAPDGLQLELVATRAYQAPIRWTGSPVASERAIGGIQAVTLVERELGPTQLILEKIFGFRLAGEKGGRYRFELEDGGVGKSLYVVIDRDGLAGRQGHGGVHHVAFRVPSEEVQMDLRLQVIRAGLSVSAVLDREYFRSIYFREPGGVLFEIATDEPGFLVDENADELGSRLQLPRQFESFRVQIERSLPEIEFKRKGK